MILGGIFRDLLEDITNPEVEENSKKSNLTTRGIYLEVLLDSSLFVLAD